MFAAVITCQYTVSLIYREKEKVVNSLDLRESLVAADSFAAVKIRIDTGISLIKQVLTVLARRMRSRTGPAAVVGRSRRTGRCTVVTVTIKARVGSVSYTAVVSAVGAGGVVVTGGGVTGAGSAVGSTGGAVGSTGGAAVVAVRVDTGVSSVSHAAAVGAMSTLGGVVGSVGSGAGVGASLLRLIVVKCLLDLVDDSGHFEKSLGL